MCGRTACTLNKNDICQSMRYQNSARRMVKPRWREDPGGHDYVPSYNKPPGTYCPVLISAKHVESDSSNDERVFQPMLWGLLPAWYKDSSSSKKYNMSNCKSETMLSKQSFKQPLSRGQRCVVVVDGFYEWKRPSKGQKQPYFIHFNEKGGGHTGHRLLTMAGIFEINTKVDSHPTYSFTVITMESVSPVDKVHDRMPVILGNEDAVERWLHFGCYSMTEALKVVKPYYNLEMYPVSVVVNNTRNNSEECLKPLGSRTEQSVEKSSVKKVTPKRSSSLSPSKSPKHIKTEGTKTGNSLLTWLKKE